MSVVTLQQVKDYLRVTHDDDDAMLQRLLDGAEDEALQYLDLTDLPRSSSPRERDFDSDTYPSSDSDDIAPSVRMGIYLLVQGMYEATKPEELAVYRAAFEHKLMPYRDTLGV